MYVGGGARFYANYHLDEEGGMSCLLLSPRGASVIKAARQLQRFFTIEQYRLLILARLPGPSRGTRRCQNCTPTTKPSRKICGG